MNKDAFLIRKVRFKCYDLILFIIFPLFMAKSQTTNFLTAKNQINKISEADLIKSLEQVKASNDRIRESFKSDVESMSFKAGR